MSMRVDPAFIRTIPASPLNKGSFANPCIVVVLRHVIERAVRVREARLVPF